MKSLDKERTVNLLWTGGWDSTFRLCQLVLLQKQKVQPFYLIDENRLSLRNELVAQKEIKAALYKKFPSTKNLILATKIFSISDLETDPVIIKNYKIINRKVGFGMQYTWLAAFCKINNINDLELSFEKAENGIKGNFLKPYMQSCRVNNTETFCIKINKTDSEISQLFRYYLWPLWETSRDDMMTISKTYNFFDILNLSWFCHSPHGNKPCGVCNPCKDVVEYGMSYRLSNRAKLRYHTRILNLRSFKKKLTKLNFEDD